MSPMAGRTISHANAMTSMGLGWTLYETRDHLIQLQRFQIETRKHLIALQRINGLKVPQE